MLPCLTTRAARPRTWVLNPQSIRCEDQHDLVLARVREPDNHYHPENQPYRAALRTEPAF